MKKLSNASEYGTHAARVVTTVAALWLAAASSQVLAEPPPAPDATGDIKEHRREASEHASQAREHAAEAMKLHRAEARAKLSELRETAREQRDVVRDELKQARVSAREQFLQARQQLKTVGQSAREELQGARDALHDGLLSGKAELKVAGEKLNTEFAILRERATEARARVWAQWKVKLRSREAIDARIQREFEKHARREAKLQRIESVARDEHDSEALDRAARLRAQETDRHELRMQKLTDDQAGSGQAKGEPQP